MTISISPSPTAVVPGQPVTLTLAGAATGRVGEFELLGVPPLSALPIGRLLDAKGAVQVPTIEAPASTFTPDVAGVYQLSAFVIAIDPGNGDYEGDPMGAPRRTVETVVDGAVYCGAQMDLPIRTQAGHGATLRLVVAGATVRAASLVSPLTELSRVAALDFAVVVALTGLVGIGTTAMDAEFVADVRVLRAAYEAHRVLTTGSPEVHTAADLTNVMRRETPTAMAAALATLNDLYDQLLGHTTAGALGGTWHTNDDGINVPLCGKATGLGSAVVLKADLRERVLRRHRTQVGVDPVKVHGSADGASTIAAPLPLPVLIVAYLDAIALALPTAPTGEEQGAVTLTHNLGFSATS